MGWTEGAGHAWLGAAQSPSPEKSSAGLSSFSLRVFSKWDRSRLVGSLVSSTSSGGKRQGDLLLLEEGIHTGAHTSYCWGEGTGERTHLEPTDPPGASAATAAFDTLCSFSFAKVPGGCQGCGCWGKHRGQLLGPQEGLVGEAHSVSPGKAGTGARGERKGRAWKGLLGLRRSTGQEHMWHLLGDTAPARPDASPAAALLQV